MLAALIPHLLALISIFRPSTRFLTAPIGIRMAFTEKQYEAAFRWSSSLPQWEAVFLVRQSSCNGAVDESEWTEIEPEWQWTYFSLSRMWEVEYTVFVQDLYPECQYQYQIGNGLLWTKQRTFSVRTPYNPSFPSPEDFNHPASLLVVGDLGTGPFSDPTLEALQSLAETAQYDAMIHLGDIAYDLDSYDSGLSRAYFYDLEPIASLLPYMVLPGNHENISGFSRYISDFRMPLNEFNNGTNFFYSFNYGRAHFVAFSTEHIYSYSSAEHLNWLRNDLRAANRNRAAVPWLIVMGHRPLYCSLDNSREPGWDSDLESNTDCGPRAEILRGMLEGLFVSEKVDLVLEAHVHNYQRFTPIAFGRSQLSVGDTLSEYHDPSAPVYILEGSAGNREGNDPLTTTPQPWLASHDRELGFGTLRVFNGSHLLWEHWDSYSQSKTDFLWIVKTKNV